MLHPFKDGPHAVVVSLQNGIELVIMTPCAANREPEEGAARGADKIMHLIRSLIRPQHRVLALHLIPGTRHQKSRAFILAKLVAGDLFTYKLVIRFVLVECTDDIIAIRPRIGPHTVHFKAMAFGEAHHIQPMPRPSFAIAW